jgi:hypothetical protein
MAGTKRTLEARELDGKHHDKERAKLRRAWRSIINSPLVKGNENLTPAQREMIDNSGKTIARAAGLLRKPLSELIGQEFGAMHARHDDAIGICGEGYADLPGGNYTRRIFAAIAMREYDLDQKEIRGLCDNYIYDKDLEFAAVLAAITLRPPNPETDGKYGRLEHLYDVRNIMETFAPRLWKDKGVKARLLGYVEERLWSEGI